MALAGMKNARKNAPTPKLGNDFEHGVPHLHKCIEKNTIQLSAAMRVSGVLLTVVSFVPISHRVITAEPIWQRVAPAFWSYGWQSIWLVSLVLALSAGILAVKSLILPPVDRRRQVACIIVSIATVAFAHYTLRFLTSHNIYATISGYGAFSRIIKAHRLLIGVLGIVACVVVISQIRRMFWNKLEPSMIWLTWPVALIICIWCIARICLGVMHLFPTNAAGNFEFPAWYKLTLGYFLPFREAVEWGGAAVLSLGAVHLWYLIRQVQSTCSCTCVRCGYERGADGIVCPECGLI